MVLAIFAIAITAASTRDLEEALTWWQVAGEVLIQNLDWTIGSFVAVVLAFYVAVLAGELGDDEEHAGRTRALLGFIAELMAATLTFFGAIILVHCIRNPQAWGVWFAFAPVAGLVVFIALSLGKFSIASPAVRLESAKEKQAWARATLSRLRYRTRLPVLLVFAANVLTGAALGTIACIPQNYTELLQAAGLFALVAALLTAANFLFLILRSTSQDRYSRAVSTLMPVAVSGSLLWSIVNVILAYGDAGARLGFAVSVVLLFALVSAFGRWARPSRLSQWSVRSAAARCSSRSVTGTLVSSSREIRLLDPRVPEENASTWFKRLLKGLRR